MPLAVGRGSGYGRTGVLVVVALITIATTAACGSTSEPRTGISGSVRDYDSFGGTVPVADNQVGCRDAATHKQVQTTRTDRRGRFFLSVPAGRYEVAYSSGSRPGGVDVTVVAGEVTTLEPFVGTMFGPHTSPDEKHLKEMLQPEALALGMKRKTAMLAVIGTTAGAATKLFGTGSEPPADTHVWVCVLTGEAEGSSSTMASHDLAGGGFVAYELRASTLERLAIRSAAKKWRLLDWAGDDGWSGTSIRPLF